MGPMRLGGVTFHRVGPIRFNSMTAYDTVDRFDCSIVVRPDDLSPRGCETLVEHERRES
jgi:hypothetical protein